MNDGRQSLWSFVTLDAYKRPPEPSAEAARSGMRAFLGHMWRRAKPEGAVSVEAELQSVPQRQLDRAAPAPYWDDASEALRRTLTESIPPDPGEPFVHPVIGPPGSGTRHIIAHAAETQGWKVFDPPSWEEILRGAGEWLSRVENAEEELLVMPCLDRCYLRHHNGLSAIRAFFDTIRRQRRRCLVGCNSWAWAYLRTAAQIEGRHSVPLTLRPFDGANLSRWFRDLAASSGAYPVTFLQSDTGEVVLSTEDHDERGSGDAAHKTGGRAQAGAEAPAFLKHVAGRSRGIPLVAWAIWRNSLRITAKDKIEEEAVEASRLQEGLTIWVRPWPRTTLPSVPSDLGRPEAFVLHTLLIHNGLPADLLPVLLPFAPSVISQSLDRLNAAGLVKFEADLWRVTLLGYPAVRQYLYYEDYLVDEL